MKRAVSLVISGVILGIIYWRVDLAALGEALVETDPRWLGLAIAMVATTVSATAFRLQRLAPDAARMSFGEANRLILAAAVLNMVLPSKMGDVAKAWFIRRPGAVPGELALALVIFEKTLDLLSLLAWCVFGLLVFTPDSVLLWQLGGVVATGLIVGCVMLGSRASAARAFGLASRLAPGKVGARVAAVGEAWGVMQSHLASRPARVAEVVAWSLGIWLLHLVQIWLFIVALGAGGEVTLVENLGVTPLAILAGLMPLTFAGVGVRDAALVWFYAEQRGEMTGATAAALGVLCTLRYVLPALGGAPFFSRYLTAARAARASAELMPGAAESPPSN